VITAAAIIMVCVFSAFVLGVDRQLKLFGLGMAVAVFVDATIVRMILVPATMELLGARNWWIPAWLDRILPRLDVEGSHDYVASISVHDGETRDDTDERELVGVD
jgi:RND superfamily putative drug exporter